MGSTTESSQRIRLVCFDLGGVIIRICRTWAEGCSKNGVDVRHDDGEFESIMPRWMELIATYQTGRSSIADYAAGVSALLEGRYSPDEVERIHRGWMYGPYDDCTAIIHDLHDAGFGTAAFSNTSHEHWGEINTVDAVKAMQHRHASHLLGLHKPDPASYRAIEAETGQDAAGILFFDDTPENVEAARAVGWSAETIDPHQPTAPQIRTHLKNHSILDF